MAGNAYHDIDFIHSTLKVHFEDVQRRKESAEKMEPKIDPIFQGASTGSCETPVWGLIEGYRAARKAYEDDHGQMPKTEQDVDNIIKESEKGKPNTKLSDIYTWLIKLGQFDREIDELASRVTTT